MKTKRALSSVLFLVLSVMSANDSHAQTASTTETAPTVEHRLSESQLISIRSIQTRAALRATPLALHLALTAKRIYENLLRDKEDVRLRVRLDAEIHRIGGELLTIKGQSIREAVRVLTPEQKKLIKSELQKPNPPDDLMELIVRTFNIPEK